MDMQIKNKFQKVFITRFNWVSNLVHLTKGNNPISLQPYE